MGKKVSEIMWLKLLFCSILLPSVLGSNLICYYSPIMEKNITYQPLMTECPPTEVCFKAVGWYGRHKSLTTRGCVNSRDCNRKHILRFKGTLYTLSYTCCESAYCNLSAGLEVHTFSIVMALMVEAVIIGNW